MTAHNLSLTEMEPEEGLRSPPKPGRAARALALMAASVLTIGIAAIAYTHPKVSPQSSTQPAPRRPLVVKAPLTEVVYISASDGDTRVLATIRDGGVEWRVLRRPAPTPERKR